MFPIGFSLRLVKWNRSCHAKTLNCWLYRQSWKPSQTSFLIASNTSTFSRSPLQLKSRELPFYRLRWCNVSRSLPNYSVTFLLERVYPSLRTTKHSNCDSLLVLRLQAGSGSWLLFLVWRIGDSCRRVCRFAPSRGLHPGITTDNLFIF